MKNLILLLLYILIAHAAFSQLNYIKADTLTKKLDSILDDERNINGFDVNEKEEYFLMTGNNSGSTLFKFYDNKCESYFFDTICPSRICIKKDSLIFFDMDEKTLYIFSIRSMNLISKAKLIVHSIINSYAYMDNMLILQLRKYPPVHHSPQLQLVGYGFNGAIIGHLKDRTGILGSAINYPFHIEQNWETPFYIGAWNSSLIYASFDIDAMEDIIIFYNLKNNKLNISTNQNIGESLYDPWREHIKIMNGQLYWLSKSNNYLFVNKYHLQAKN